MTRPAATPELDAIFRAEWGRLVATATRLVGDLDRAEELVQEALVAACERWPSEGLPERPGAWLMTTTRNRALDSLRQRGREQAKRSRLAASLPTRAILAEADVPTDPDPLPDDRLRLLFTCCHPALPRESQVALTLRLLGGLSTPEIAAAFLVAESTAAQRIVRAKRAIRERRLPYRVPGPAELPARLPAVLDVVYLVFNEGYAARAGDAPVRQRLCDDALDLARAIEASLPGEQEAVGLLALLELQASRLPARSNARGRLVLLEDQDRGLWDRAAIARARERLPRATGPAEPGPYALQAAIAACHASAEHFADTDWAEIVALYDALLARTASPVVALNRAVALGMRDGASAGLAAVAPLADDPRLARYAWLPAARADFLRRLGRPREAADAYRRARDLAGNAAERDHLERRLAACEAGAGD